MNGEKTAMLKAEERIQLIKGAEAGASRNIITAYNDINGINRPGMTKDRVLQGCINQLESAIKYLSYASKLYSAEATPELGSHIKAHFEQQRRDNQYLQCILPHRARGGSDEA